jgi:hypothetical protein
LDPLDLKVWMVSRVLWDFRVLPVQQGLKALWAPKEPKELKELKVTRVLQVQLDPELKAIRVTKESQDPPEPKVLKEIKVQRDALDLREPKGLRVIKV